MLGINVRITRIRVGLKQYEPTQRGWSVESLADWLGIATDEYALLDGERRPLYVQYTPETGELALDPGPLQALAERLGAHATRLYEAFYAADRRG